MAVPFWLISSVRLPAPVLLADGSTRPIGSQHTELARLLGLPGRVPGRSLTGSS